MLRFAMRSVSAAGLGVGFALMVTASCGQRFSTTSEGAGGQADADPSPGGGTDQPSGGGSGEGSGGRGLDDGGAPSTDAGGVGAKGGATASPGGAADGSGGEAGTGGGGTSGPGGVNGASGAGGRRSCPTIEVKAATFAANCAAPTDLTSYVTADCDGRTQCDFTLLPPSDPAFGCEKDFSIEYDCVDPSQGVVASPSAYIPGPAETRSMLFLCKCPCDASEADDSADEPAIGAAESCPVIAVTSAIYAENCGVPTELAAYVSVACDGKTRCDYTFLPPFDPAFGCEKELSIEYDCVGPACVGGEQNVVGSSSAYIPGDVVGASTLLSCECL